MKPDAEEWDRLCAGCLGGGCDECGKGFIRERARPSPNQEGIELFEAYQWLKNYGQMPTSGAYSQQSAAFVSAVKLCDAAHSGYARARERRNQDVSKLHANLQKMMGKNAGR